MKPKPPPTAAKPDSRRRVFIVDDHPMMRQGIAQLIGFEADLVVVGEAESAGAALGEIIRLRPDLALVDITLPDKSGLELIKDLQSACPEVRTLVLSMHDESLYAERVLRAGGRGYITKQEGGLKLMEAIRQVLANKIYVSPGISARILEIFSGRAGEGAGSPVELLTDREFEVFQHIGQGMSTKEIAAKLHLSVKTVEAHRLNIKTKLSLKTSAELIRHAVRWIESQVR